MRPCDRRQKQHRRDTLSRGVRGGTLSLGHTTGSGQDRPRINLVGVKSTLVPNSRAHTSAGSGPGRPAAPSPFGEPGGVRSPPTALSAQSARRRLSHRRGGTPGNTRHTHDTPDSKDARPVAVRPSAKRETAFGSTRAEARIQAAAVSIPGTVPFTCSPRPCDAPCFDADFRVVPRVRSIPSAAHARIFFNPRGTPRGVLGVRGRGKCRLAAPLGPAVSPSRQKVRSPLACTFAVSSGRPSKSAFNFALQRARSHTSR